jgi:hypothetical protein
MDPRLRGDDNERRWTMPVDLLDRAMKAIREVQADTSVDPQATLQRLELLADELDGFIQALKDEIDV